MPRPRHRGARIPRPCLGWLAKADLCDGGPPSPLASWHRLKGSRVFGLRLQSVRSSSWEPELLVRRREEDFRRPVFRAQLDGRKVGQLRRASEARTWNFWGPPTKNPTSPVPAEVRVGPPARSGRRCRVSRPTRAGTVAVAAGRLAGSRCAM
ncbi:hypothetical protein BO70DRAFT_25198 [Aspergillus heteromorphus CBS 117.55]|uniref:Uncharacterized protein n=1 Tax=Aspergillus heteromorphus CBS 117.55 TaxID=1448321 RepID=A0A317WCB8_9EURO|nr:uncharacterized protein BO70DRAFT_25198 [Aspergillus heteromorphus CBS 117.55]PWY83411.1 hypothetical protein BO70DRAFT_25198 [Aspergillus heteromorphus CBS 117.55]